MKRKPKQRIADEPAAMRALLRYMQRPDYAPLTQRELLHDLHLGPEERPSFRRVIRLLLNEGRIRRVRGGRLATSMSTRGARRATSVDSPGAEVREIVGIFEPRGRGGTVQPFDLTRTEPIHIPAAFRMGARRQQAVRVELLRDGEGKVLETLGGIDDPGTDSLIVLRKYGLRSEFGDAAQTAAGKLPSRIPRGARRAREVFDDPPAVTIDGETARDFDDAIAVMELPSGGFRLFVHVADVTHFVRPNDVLDREARVRGTSVYFPDRVLPMLPEKLSTDLCSLRPGVERLVQSVILDVDEEGRTRGIRLADGMIRSAARLTYAQAARALGGATRVRGVPAPVLPMLRAASSLREALEQRRARRGSVDVDLPEPQILLDVEGCVTGVTTEPRNEAHRLIEECMIAANEAVASYLEERGWPCLFRNHDDPDRARIEVLASFARSFGLTLRGKPGRTRPGDIRELLEQAEGRPEQAVVSQVALRSMRQARYGTANLGHFGLALGSYCHFTSPIRRYPDLITHRLLRACRAKRPDEVPPLAELEALAQSCCELERNAEAAERDLLLWKKIAFIRDKVGEAYPGVVTGVAPFGLFVQLTESLVEGLLRVEGLGREWFAFDEGRQELRGSTTGRRFRLGDRLVVTVERVDRVRQRVDFALE